MTRFAATLCAALLLLAATPASAAPVGSAGAQPAPVATLVVAAPLVAGIFDTVFGLSAGLDDLETHVREQSIGYGPQFRTWGNALYTSLFLLQFLLIGATMVIRGPFALTSARPVNALGPFANFFFFLIAGAFGYLLVSNSYYPVGSGDEARFGGWMPWFFDVFTEAGQATGCSDNEVLGIFDPCSPDRLAGIGAKVSGLITAFSTRGGGSESISNRLFSTIGASSGVFGAFSVLAIQLSITRIAFYLTIVTAPFFLATLIFKPISGIATGFISFVVYLGVRLFVLYLVAGLAAYIASEWLDSLIRDLLIQAATGAVGLPSGSVANQIFSTNMSVLTVSLLFLGLTIYLPSRIASSISGAFRLDLNALLFRGELPIQID